MLGGRRSGSSDLLLLPSLHLPLPSSIPLRATHNLQSAGPQQGCGQAESKLGTESKLGLQRYRSGSASLPRTSCLVSPWYDQTCTVSGPVPGSSAASLWPFCCPQTCHLEWLLDSGYGSCRDKAEAGHAREPQRRLDGSIIIPVPQSRQFPLEACHCSTAWSHV